LQIVKLLSRIEFTQILIPATGEVNLVIELTIFTAEAKPGGDYE
jgi:hypothetical protein